MLVLGVLCTAGAPRVRRSVAGAVPTDHPRTALIPFENLAGREEQSEIFTKVFFAQLVASGSLDMVDPTQVDAAMDSLDIRSATSMTPLGLRTLADTLHARYLLLGSVLESGSIQTGNGPVPAVGAALRMVEPTNGRVVWAAAHFRSGEDRETVFGWGRVMSTERLISELASDMLQDFRAAGQRRSQDLRTEKAR